jgi:hypothetical protein
MHNQNEIRMVLRAYVRSVAIILGLTALAKLYSATGGARILDLPEALLPLTNRQTLVLVGIIELIVALSMVVAKSNAMKLIGTAWLSLNFILYRAASLLLVVGRPCPCLGSITERLPLKPAVIDRILISVVVYLFLGSCFFLVVLRRCRSAVNSQRSGLPAVAGHSMI